MVLTMVCGLMFAQPCKSQETQVNSGPDPVELKLANEFKRIQMFFDIARNRIVGDNETEATPEQIEEFKALEKKREEVQSLIHESVKIKDFDKRMASLKTVTVAMSELEGQLVDEILLPHQVVILRQREFKRLLDQKAGNFEAVIEEHYGKKFGMTDSQKKALKKVRRDQYLEKKKASQEYALKVQKIDAEAKSKLGKILTPQQIKMVEELSGIEFSKAP